MSEAVRVVKMSGAGNDFVVLGPDQIVQLGDGLVGWVRSICRRGVSVGADGVLLVEPMEPGRVRVRYLNADGTPAFCGNGSRCAARFAHFAGLAGSSMVLETDAGDMPASVEGEHVRVAMPRPEEPTVHRVEIDGRILTGTQVTAGVPHFVLFVDDLAGAPLHALGPALRRHGSFGPSGTNVNLVAWQGDDLLGVRTFERGVEGETLSCGSGALAAAWAVRLWEAPGCVRVRPRSGMTLEITSPAAQGDDRVELAGDARIVFEAQVNGEALRGSM